MGRRRWFLLFEVLDLRVLPRIAYTVEEETKYNPCNIRSGNSKSDPPCSRAM